MLLSLIQLVLLALGMIGVLALFFSLKRELRRLSKPARLPLRTMRPGINIANRFEILRLARKGEDPGRISAALGIPRREVELLIRVHQISS